MKALKIWPDQFEAVRTGEKTAEFRRNDRDYIIGDTLRLMKFDPETELLSGEYIDVSVTSITYGPDFGIPKKYCVMSICKVGPE